MQTASVQTSISSRVAIQPRVISFGGAAVLAITSLALFVGGFRHFLLALIGVGAGIALYHASFGFTAAWRRMLVERRSLGLRVQLVMLALAITLFFPLLGQGVIWGQTLSGFLNPVGLALCAGAFVFGIGMQLGGGCGSGTLFTLGGGSTRMVVTLAAFILGSLIATADPLGWMSWPSLGAYSAIESFGTLGALFFGLSALLLVFLLVQHIEIKKHGALHPITLHWTGTWLSGPWPLLVGALALVIVNVATLTIAGRPWGITTAFALWGAKLAIAAGLDVSSWAYWRGDASLNASVFADITSVMNFGIICGALVAAGLAGKFAPQTKISFRSLLAAVIGGLLMGVGARLATGCNIGAFFSGIASGSLHGLVWLLFAVPGNAIGVWLRPKFGLD